MRLLLNEWRKFLDEGLGDVSDEQKERVAAQAQRIKDVKALADSVYKMSTQPGPGLPFEDIHGMDPKDLRSLIVRRHDDVEAAQAVLDALESGDVEQICPINDEINAEKETSAGIAQNIYSTAPNPKSATS
jgi:hypothetical protein